MNMSLGFLLHHHMLIEQLFFLIRFKSSLFTDVLLMMKLLLVTKVTVYKILSIKMIMNSSTIKVHYYTFSSLKNNLDYP